MSDNQLSFFESESNDLAEVGVVPVNPEEDLKHVEWLNGLLALEGIGNTKAILLAKTFRSYSSLLNAQEANIQSVIGKNRIDFTKLERISLAEFAGVKKIGYFDTEYPSGLRDLSDAPPILWVRGEIPKNKSLTIIGTRNADEWGRKITQRLACLAGENGFSVISGLALGIDTAAHLGCLESQSPTVAILACDVRFPTPKSNVRLSERILESGGCLISEVPFGTQAESYNLIARDRLQAAWSQGLLLTQCGIPSGALHTVRFAMELKREVMVLKPPEKAEGKQYAGNRNLIDESKFDSSILGGTKKFQKLASSRRMGADIVLSSVSEFEEYLNNA